MGPFSKEIQSGRMFSPQALGIPLETIIRLAWIDLEENEARRRMQHRADPRDNWKLEHWDRYVVRRTEPPTHKALKRFDNLEYNPEQFNQLIEHLIQ